MPGRSVCAGTGRSVLAIFDDLKQSLSTLAGTKLSYLNFIEEFREFWAIMNGLNLLVGGRGGRAHFYLAGLHLGLHSGGFAVPAASGRVARFLSWCRWHVACGRWVIWRGGVGRCCEARRSARRRATRPFPPPGRSRSPRPPAKAVGPRPVTPAVTLGSRRAAGDIRTVTARGYLSPCPYRASKRSKSLGGACAVALASPAAAAVVH
jgi:hypothetical protein